MFLSDDDSELFYVGKLTDHERKGYPYAVAAVASFRRGRTADAVRQAREAAQRWAQWQPWSDAFCEEVWRRPPDDREPRI